MAIFEVAEDTGLLTPLAGQGIPVEELPRGLRLTDQPLFEQAAECGEAVFVADVSTNEAISAELVDEFDLRSALAVPLVSEGRCLGILAADRKGEPFELEAGTLDMLTTIGAVAGVYLERALELTELETAERGRAELRRARLARASNSGRGRARNRRDSPSPR